MGAAFSPAASAGEATATAETGAGECPLEPGFTGSDVEWLEQGLGDAFVDLFYTEGGTVIGVYGLSDAEMAALISCGYFVDILVRPVSSQALTAAQDLAVERLNGLFETIKPDYARGTLVVTVVEDEIDAAVRQAEGVPDLAVMLETPAGTPDKVRLEFEVGPEVKPAPGHTSPVELALTPDMTGDRFGDVLAVDSSGELRVFRGTANGFTQERTLLGLTGLTGTKVYGPGDWSNDGKADLAVVDQAGDLWVHKGDGQGAIATERTKIGHGWSAFAAVPAGDLTGDRQPDLLGTETATGDLYLYKWIPSRGGFHTKRLVGWGWKGWQLHAGGDLNGDGLTDIIGIDSKGDLYCYSGNGNGAFPHKVKCGNGWGSYQLAAGADLNADGLADIVGKDTVTGDVYYYKGLGKGRFATKHRVLGFGIYPYPLPGSGS
jgi:hypothetical protein